MNEKPTYTLDCKDLRVDRECIESETMVTLILKFSFLTDCKFASRLRGEFLGTKPVPLSVASTAITFLQYCRTVFPNVLYEYI